MTIAASWFVPLAGTHLPQGFVVVAAVAAAWAWHARRLRARERHLALLTGERIRGLGAPWLPASDASEAPRGEAMWAEGPLEENPSAGAMEPERSAGVLVVGSRGILPLVEDALHEVAPVVAVADSTWSARVACRDAFDAGRPYNLVLLDASVADLDEGGVVSQLEEDLYELGARVAMIRPRSGGSEEGIRCHENPDRRGRIGLAAAARADAAPLGLRGDCRE